MGKSSLINRIAKKVSTNVGNKPGVTKQKQWIRIDNNVELLDTPGVLWPKFENEKVALNLAFTGTIKQDVIDEIEVAFHLLKYLINNEQEKLCNRYSLTKQDIVDFTDEKEDGILNLMHLIGKKRGAIISGGRIDEVKTARILLEDFKSGKMGRITLEKAK